MSSDLELLCGNFLELYNAEHSLQGKTLPITANYSGTHVYDSRYGWGSFWKSFWPTAEQQLNAVKAAIVHTHQIFQRQLPIIESALKRYEEYFKQASNGYAVVETDIHESRKLITQWYSSTAPFLRMVNKHSSLHIQKLFYRCFPEKSMPQIFAYQSDSAVRSCHRMIVLEKISQSPLPFALFKKMIKKKPLTPLDQSELEKWIGIINKTENQIHHIHRGLNAMVHRWTKNKTDLPLNVVNFELLLENKGCTVFKQNDEKQLEWQKKLKKGTTITHQDKELILGDELLLLSTSGTRIFKIDGLDDHLLMTAQNPTILTLQQHQQSLKQKEIPAQASIIEVDKKGRFALIEHLQPFSTAWLEDNRALAALQNLLKEMCSNSYTLEKLSIKMLLLDCRHHLKVLHPTKKLPFDFNAIEEFILDCSSGNLSVYKQLMTHSGLHQHPVSQFYRDLLEFALEGKKVEIDDMAATYKISDHKIVDRGIKLSKKIKKFQDQLYSDLKRKFPEKNEATLYQKVNQAILAGHHSTKASGMLHPQFFEIVKQILEQ